MTEFFTQHKELILRFLLNNFFMILVGSIAGSIANKASILRKKGYSDEYIKLTKKITAQTVPRIFAVLILSQILFGIVVYFIAGEINKDLYQQYVIIGSFLITLPFAIYYNRIKSIEYKKLAIETRSEIIVDFNYRTLNLIFNKYIEIPVLLMVLTFAVIHLDIHFAGLILIYVLLPWFFAGILRDSKNLNIAVFKNTYLVIAKLNIIYQGLLIFLLAVGTYRNIDEFEWYNYLFFGLICAVLAVKVVFYVLKYPKLKRQVEKLNEKNFNPVNT